MTWKFRDHSADSFKKFQWQWNQGKRTKMIFCELHKFLNIKDSKVLACQILFFLKWETDGEGGEDIDGCLNPETGFWVLNISCQLSTVALVSPSVRCWKCGKRTNKWCWCCLETLTWPKNCCLWESDSGTTCNRND